MKNIIINYSPALQFLYDYIQIEKKQNEPGVNDIMFQLVQSYLVNDISSPEHTVVFKNTLEYFGIVNFEDTALAVELTDFISEITKVYLPGFRIYNDSLETYQIGKLTRANIVLSITDEQYEQYTQPIDEFNPIRTTIWTSEFNYSFCEPQRL